jgi:beta-ureidopropionase / N-carbamoyl-L-amino-acid hydrolase
MSPSITDYVSGDRLIALIERLAQFGARDDGGVDRQALTDAEVDARRFLATHARALGCDAFNDPAGNLFFRRGGLESCAPVMTGSHIDTQPEGGKLDGAFGVCAGLEVMAALQDMHARTRRPIEVVIWANEEGCRFAPGSTGSAAFVDPERLDVFRGVLDADGVSYGECVDRMHGELHDIPLRGLRLDVHAFIEAHIEQGPVLEHAGLPIGVVSGIQGVRWYRVEARGQAAHAGTTPREQRRDALRALVDLAGEAYGLAEKTPGLRLTIGTVQVAPGAINTIPGEAALTIDVRHPEESALQRCEMLLQRFCAGPRHGCDVAFTRSMAMPTTWFSDAVKTSIRQAADRLNLESMEMLSGAFHDSIHLSHHCPTGMLFVPSRAGLSHNPQEHTDALHLVAGTRVLAAAVALHAGLMAAEGATKPAV